MRNIVEEISVSRPKVKKLIPFREKSRNRYIVIKNLSSQKILRQIYFGVFKSITVIFYYKFKLMFSNSATFFT